ncbi:hypothetical protein ACKWTF_009315 [Chironomus riparius]
MKLLYVLLVFALCINMSWSFDGSSRQLFAIDGPLYVDSASLRPAVLTHVSSNKRANFNQNNPVDFKSLQALNLLTRLLRIHNDPQTSFQLDTVFAQNQPIQTSQNDQNKRFIVINKTPYTQNDLMQKLQLDQMNAQRDQLGSIIHNYKVNTVIPHERVVRIFSVPIVKTFPVHDVPQMTHFTDLDQLNAQIDFLHQKQLEKLNGHSQNDLMQWQQNQQLFQQNPYTQNDFLNPFVQNQHTAPNFNDILAAQSFQNNPISWQVPFGLMPDEDRNDQQLQEFGNNFQNDQFQNWQGNSQADQFQNWNGNSQADQFQNWQGNAQQDQFQNWHGNAQQGQFQNFFGQQQNNQRQNFGSSNDFISDFHNDDYN